MTPHETKYFTHMHRSMIKRVASEGDEWLIPLDDWLKFWSEHPLRQLRYAYPRRACLYKRDFDAPWTLSNIVIDNQRRADPLRRKKKLVSTVRVHKKLKPESVGRNPAPEPNPTSKTLTIAEWVEQVRVHKYTATF